MKHKKLVVVGAVPTVRALLGFRGVLEQHGTCCNYCQACLIIFMANTTVRSPILRMCDRTDSSNQANPEYLRDFYPSKELIKLQKIQLIQTEISATFNNSDRVRGTGFGNSIVNKGQALPLNS